MKGFTRREFIRNAGLSLMSIGAIGDLKNSKYISLTQSTGRANMSNNPTAVNKIVVMSDLHFGDEYCFINKGEKNNIQKLIGKIKNHNPDELILLGDVFDFSLGSLYLTFDNAKGFFEELKKLHGLKVTYIPGNHDHHIWSRIIETEYFIGPLEQGEVPAKGDIYMKNAVTTIPKRAPFLNMFYPGLDVVYPHIIRTCGNATYYFTHGHLQDNVFTPGNNLLTPKNLAELEAFNSCWIEGVWFYMGQAGRLSEKIRETYLQTEISWLGYIGAFSLGAKSFINGIWEALRGKVSVLKEKEEKPLTVRAVTPAYIEDHLNLLIKDGIIEEKQFPITFVYGHTHKKEENIPGKVKISNHDYGYVKWNTGTWILKNEAEKDNNGFIVIDDKKTQWVPFWE